jgi:hypothetical protein
LSISAATDPVKAEAMRPIYGKLERKGVGFGECG